MIEKAIEIIEILSLQSENIYSTRSMAFSIKGLYYYNLENKSDKILKIIEILADRLVAMYNYVADDNWCWFESYLTYANSIIPEAVLLSWIVLKKSSYLNIAKKSFDFLLSQTFNDEQIKVISNKSWLSKGGIRDYYGEQPIDVSYTIMALDTFYNTFKEEKYLNKIKIAFNWFLGNNHLYKIIYNPCTGGCYDGLEEHNINLNQGAESTVSYLMARLIIDKYSEILNQKRENRKN
jgi:hypothetical protein